jgi:hypothetical protein
MHLLSGKVFQDDASVEQQSSIGTLLCQRCTPAYEGERISLQKGRRDRLKKRQGWPINPSLRKTRRSCAEKKN